ncbi:hypothetical protein CW304_13590 [Bacillus sp. UFRGS-B20]|nr:hypothetical protein CW304_13590 [Bacillus sp. UFRGS-B20]
MKVECQEGWGSWGSDRIFLAFPNCVDNFIPLLLHCGSPVCLTLDAFYPNFISRICWSHTLIIFVLFEMPLITACLNVLG